MPDFLQNLWEWFVEFYDLNIDRWLLVGWSVLAVLTIIATIGMILKLVKSNKGLLP